jgi:pimeloyl-ACP methyl ester carboxylesterase
MTKIHGKGRVFAVGSIAVEALVDGHGEPIVMVPSLGRSAEDFDDLSRRLALSGYCAVRIRPRGVGRSHGPAGNLTLMDLAGDVGLVIQQLGGAAVVIGHAFGQRVVRALAVEQPEQVKGIVMLAAGGMVPIPKAARTALEGCFITTNAVEHLDCVRRAFFAPGNDPTVWRDGWFPEVARLQNAADKATPVASWWHGGVAPILVVQGMQDAVALPENGRLLKSQLGKRVTLVELDGAAHALLPEQPKAIADAVLKFIAGLSR